jgi:hypothetical protein
MLAKFKDTEPVALLMVAGTELLLEDIVVNATHELDVAKFPVIVCVLDAANVFVEPAPNVKLAKVLLPLMMAFLPNVRLLKVWFPLTVPSFVKRTLLNVVPLFVSIAPFSLKVISL